MSCYSTNQKGIVSSVGPGAKPEETYAMPFAACCSKSYDGGKGTLDETCTIGNFLELGAKEGAHNLSIYGSFLGKFTSAPNAPPPPPIFDWVPHASDYHQWKPCSTHYEGDKIPGYTCQANYDWKKE